MYKFTGEEKLDVCADIAGTFFEMFQDEEVQKLQKSGAQNKDYLKPLMKNHKREMVEIMARVQSKDGVSPEEYLENVGIMAIALDFLELLGSSMVAGLFNSQGQDKKTSSGSATENTEVSEK